MRPAALSITAVSLATPPDRREHSALRARGTTPVAAEARLNAAPTPASAIIVDSHLPAPRTAEERVAAGRGLRSANQAQGGPARIAV